MPDLRRLSARGTLTLSAIRSGRALPEPPGAAGGAAGVARGAPRERAGRRTRRQA